MHKGLLLALACLAAPGLAQEMDHNAHAGHTMPGMSAPAGTDDTPGDAAPPPVPTDHPADRFFPPERMAKARADLANEGNWRGNALLVDELEYRALRGRDGYAWRVNGWAGGDIDRVVLGTEGEGEIGGRIEQVETRLLWRHALDPWFNLEAGVRHDFRPGADRTYAALGIEGLAPYWFELEAHMFVSTRGEVHLRVGGSHDVRIAGPLVIQPEAEVDVALQDVPALEIGAGLEKIELGARLRYEIRPEFAPYVGVHWERSFGGTARHLRAEGERVSAVSAVVGVRGFF